MAVPGRALSGSQERRGGRKDFRRSGHLAWRDHLVTVQRN